MTFEIWLQTKAPEVPFPSAQAVLSLVESGATVPFIARYRKEQTQNLNEVAIQAVIDLKEEWDLIGRRQANIISSIEKQGKLTAELGEQVRKTFDLDLLEDLYLPYKVKRQSKAFLAREAALQPLADWIWNCGHGLEKPQEGQTLELWAFTFRNEAKGYNDLPAVLAGAADILVERIAENIELRTMVREKLYKEGGIRSEKADKAKPNSKFEKYFSYFESVQSLLQPQNSHRYLALRRGKSEEEIHVSFGGKPEDTAFFSGMLEAFEKFACTNADSPGADILKQAARTALKVSVLPSIENEVNRVLKKLADETAIQVFALNLRRLLIAPPFGSKVVLGVDPGIRTGCKLALVDSSSKFLGGSVLMLESDEQKAQAKAQLVDFLKQVQIDCIAVGNGTAGRETEVFFRQAIKEGGLKVPVVMVSEAGASVYSASEAARDEFPELDVTIRGAISIARRLQDPLAELVKVDPKSIGVGQYQHDVAPHALKKSLDLVVDSCVNSVGVNLNTASHHLLSRVAGIGENLAKAIVLKRQVEGLFKTRSDLLTVPHFGQKNFEQAAGFLRIPGGANPLDNTGVHPERYVLLEKLVERLGKSVGDLLGGGVQWVRAESQFKTEVGDFTFEDICNELEKPGRDPRDHFVPFEFRDGVFELKDLKPGMVCPGIVTNVTNFGAFIDIGVHQDGLVHLSQLADRFVKDPLEIVKPGDRVQVRVLEVNLEKSQISLTMKRPPEARPVRPPRPKAPPTRQENRGPKRPPRPVFKNDAFAALAALKKK